MMRSKFVAMILAALLLLIGSAACKDRSKTAAGPAGVDRLEVTTTEITEEQDRQYHEQAALMLKAMEQSLPAKSNEQLVAMLHDNKIADGQAGFLDMYIAKGGNQLIEAALRKRGVAARAALKAHEVDLRTLYTGEPQLKTVGMLCAEIRTASKPPADLARDRQLIIAAYNGELPAVRKLIAEGADVDARYGETGKDVFNNYPLTAALWTPLMVVLRNDHSFEHLDVLRALVEAGANVNLFDDNGDSAFDEALHKDNYELVKYLLDHGADIHQRAPLGGQTAIYYAPNDSGILDLLIARGADVNSKNDSGDSPLYSAARGSDLDAVRKLLKAGANINAQNSQGESPLHGATEPAMARLLLASGARPDLKDRNGFTALMKVEWSVQSMELDRLAYLRMINPPRGWTGGWDVSALRDPNLELLQTRGMTGEMLAHRLNDLRATETKALAGALKSGEGK